MRESMQLIVTIATSSMLIRSTDTVADKIFR